MECSLDAGHVAAILAPATAVVLRGDLTRGGIAEAIHEGFDLLDRNIRAPATGLLLRSNVALASQQPDPSLHRSLADAETSGKIRV
jgi:hypothetical protein